MAGVKIPPWLADIAQLLRERCPAHLPVVVVMREKVGPGRRGSVAGRCLLQRWKRRAPRFVLEIQTGQRRTEARDTLVHEWAHALTWRNCDHGKKWGEAYARAYRAVVGE